MKAVQSKSMIAITQPPLWVGSKPCRAGTVRDEIVHNYYGTLAEKNTLPLIGVKCMYLFSYYDVILFFEL